MKKLLGVIVFLVSFVLCSNAQIPTIKITDVAYTGYIEGILGKNQEGQWSPWSDWLPCDISITIEPVNSSYSELNEMVVIPNKFNDVFLLARILNKVTACDTLSNILYKGVTIGEYTEITYGVYDKVGSQCIISIRKGVNSKIIFIQIIYKNFKYMYQGKLIDNKSKEIISGL